MITRFMVMKALPFEAISVHGVPLQPDKPPRHFIPVFDTREEAAAWLGDDDAEILPILCAHEFR